MSKAKKDKTKFRSSEWYSEEQVYNLLQLYVGKGTNHINISQALSTSKQLTYHLSQLSQLNKAQHIIPLHVSVLNGEIDATGNHWVGLQILVNSSNNSAIVNYIDPMGRPINQELCIAIKKQLLLSFVSVNVEQPLLNKGIQVAPFDPSGSFLVDNANDYDCGPMLVYIMASRVRAIDLVKIGTEVESISLGSYLRDIYGTRTHIILQ